MAFFESSKSSIWEYFQTFSSDHYLVKGGRIDRLWKIHSLRSNGDLKMSPWQTSKTLSELFETKASWELQESGILLNHKSQNFSSLAGLPESGFTTLEVGLQDDEVANRRQKERRRDCSLIIQRTGEPGATNRLASPPLFFLLPLSLLFLVANGSYFSLSERTLMMLIGAKWPAEAVIWWMQSLSLSCPLSLSLSWNRKIKKILLKRGSPVRCW